MKTYRILLATLALALLGACGAADITGPSTPPAPAVSRDNVGVLGTGA